jgi:hypothetical protein
MGFGFVPETAQLLQAHCRNRRDWKTQSVPYRSRRERRFRTSFRFSIPAFRTARFFAVTQPNYARV